ncbi:hypothetical protein AGMMS50268_25270 [Spirochaetia bacterium]|nr:hypothetical protein AGMMS50268_25270 [Spirochaetia bacterium]
MKRKLTIIMGILAIALAFALVIAGCDTGNGGGTTPTTENPGTPGEPGAPGEPEGPGIPEADTVMNATSPLGTVKSRAALTDAQKTTISANITGAINDASFAWYKTYMGTGGMNIWIENGGTPGVETGVHLTLAEVSAAKSAIIARIIVLLNDQGIKTPEAKTFPAQWVGAKEVSVTLDAAVINLADLTDAEWTVIVNNIRDGFKYIEGGAKKDLAELVDRIYIINSPNLFGRTSDMKKLTLGIGLVKGRAPFAIFAELEDAITTGNIITQTMNKGQKSANMKQTMLAQADRQFKATRAGWNRNAHSISAQRSARMIG